MSRFLHDSPWQPLRFALLATLLLVMLAACSGPDDDRPLSQDDGATQSPAPAMTATTPAVSTPGSSPPTPLTAASATATQADATAESTSTTETAATTTPATTPPPVAPSATTTTTAEPTATQPPALFDPARVSIEIEQVASGFSEPLAVTHANDGSGRIFVAEKTGAIRLLDGTMFLDLTDRVIKPGISGRDHELGLLGLAFHPRFAETGWLYVNYSDFSGNNVIARYTAGPDGLPDRNSEMIMLYLEQPDVNFNGGGLVFGPDGYLYIGTGTGGEYDEHGDIDTLQHQAQDPGNLFGKILRIDVNNGEPYSIPPDNPFAGQDGVRQEIYILGVRNPYRFAFDSATGDLFIGAPGQFQREWIEYVPAGQQNGAVLRWPYLEGSLCSTHVDSCNTADFPPPIIEVQTYINATCVILGGEMYRGDQFPLLQGAYLFGDFCNGPVRVGWQDANGNWDWQEVLRLPPQVANESVYLGSFGTDEAGEIYVTDIRYGIIYHVVARER